MASKRVPASGEVTFGPVPKGRYRVGVDRDQQAATVEVDGPDTVVRVGSR